MMVSDAWRLVATALAGISLLLAAGGPLLAMPYEGAGGTDGTEGEPPPPGGGGGGGSVDQARADAEAAFAELARELAAPLDSAASLEAGLSPDTALVDADLARASDLTDPDGVAKDAARSKEAVAGLSARYDVLTGQTARAAADVVAMAPVSYTPTGGDPVLLATGALSLKEVDLSYLFHATPIRVERTYRSDRNLWSSFGRGWSLPYDTRIIRGGWIDGGSLRRAAEETRALVEGIYAQDASRVRSTIDGMADRQEAVSSKTGSAAQLESAATALIAQCAPWLDLAAAAQQLLGRIHAAKVAYGVLGERLREGVSSLEALGAAAGPLSNLDAYRTECELLSEQIAKRAALAENATTLDRYALHSGDPECLRDSGVETVILIDDLGEPHLYRLATPATFGEAPTYLPETRLADGMPNFFPQGAECVPERPRDEALRLTSEGGFVLRRNDGTLYRYGTTGLLREIEDRNNNRIAFGYDEEMRLIDATDGYGRRLVIERRGDRIASVTDPLGRVVRYGYDAAGRLAEVVDPSGDRIAYHYEGGRLSAIEKPDGSMLRYAYGDVGERAKVLSTSDEEGNTEYFEYREGVTVHTNPSGITTQCAYDDRLRETRVTYADGSFVEKRYDDRGDLVSVADENGAVTGYEYDDRGNRTRITWPDGSQSTACFNRFGRPERRVDEEGYAVGYQYDDRGNLVRIEYPDATSLQFSYDADGDLTEIVDQRGNASRLARDRFGYLSEYSDPLGHSWRLAHDNVGNLTSRVDPDGVATTYGYTPDGRVARIGDSGGNTIERRYDQRKDLVARVDPNGSVTRLEFDKRHLLRRVVDPTGGTTEYFYRADGRLDRMRVGGVSTTDYAYDTRGSLSRITQVETSISTAYARDATGRVTAMTDGRGGITQYERDVRGRIVATVNPDGAVRRSEYAKNGRLVASADELGNRTERAFDALGRLVSIRDALGGEETYAYDEAGNLVRYVNRNGATTSAAYDEANRLTRTIDPTGATTRYVYSPAGRLVERVDRRGSSTRYEYNRSGRLAKVVGPLGETREYAYDGSGDLLAAADPNGHLTRWEHDFAGRVTAEIDSSGATTLLSYGAAGKMASLTDPSGAVWRYEVDAAGRLVSATNPLGEARQYAYDPAGNLIASIDPLGARITYTYDGENRLTSITDGSGAKTEYRYDPAGNRVEEIDGLGAVYAYRYDAGGRLTAEVNRSGSRKNYAYDPVGRLTSVTDFAGQTTRYERDALGRIVRIVYPDGSSRAYDYDAEGNLLGATNDAARLQFRYDESSRPVSVSEESSGEEIRYAYDPEGELLAVQRADSSPLVSYRYGVRGEVVGVTLPAIGDVVIGYDTAGREIERQLPNGVEVRHWYDRAGRVIGISASTGAAATSLWAEAYLYDAAGRRTHTLRRDGSYLAYRYDNAGRLSEVAYPYEDGTREADLDELKDTGLVGPLSSGSPASVTPSSQASSRVRAAAMPEYVSMDAESAEKLRKLAGTILPLRRAPVRLVQKAWIDSFSYDDAGNRTEKRNGFGSITYTYGADHELLSAGRKSYSYDANGNLTAEQSTSGAMLFRYGPDNRVSEVELSEGLVRSGDARVRVDSILYRYDALGRRVGRDAFSANGSRVSGLRYFYDRFSLDPIRLRIDLALPARPAPPGLVVPAPRPERSASVAAPEGPTVPPLPADATAPLRKEPAAGGPRYRYPARTTGRAGSSAAPLPLDGTAPASRDGKDSSASPGRGETTTRFYAAEKLIVTVRPSGAEYFAHDLRGSISLITDARGRNVAENTYDVFGIPTKRLFDPLRIPGYTGKDMDPETVIYNLGYRDYDPLLARFTTPDPIKSGANWYVYAENDPVNRLDPFGLDSFFATFNKDTNTMMGTYVSTTGTTINPEGTVTYSWPATNNVQHTVEQTFPDRQSYYPEPFPNGMWELVHSEPVGNAAYGPAYVGTNAHQDVTAYRYNQITDEWEPVGTTIDWGYGIHGGGYTTQSQGPAGHVYSPTIGNRVEDNTFGCIRMHNLDVTQFAQLSDLAKETGGSSTLTVVGGKGK